jgi:metal-responsive CopG/Arc/MetJ family transcriptional regulator
MKTAISLPDDVFDAAEAAARRTGMSRSQLYVTAIKHFLRAQGDRGVTERLNELYAGVESGLDPALLRMQFRATGIKEEW